MTFDEISSVVLYFRDLGYEYDSVISFYLQQKKDCHTLTLRPHFIKHEDIPELPTLAQISVSNEKSIANSFPQLSQCR